MKATVQDVVPVLPAGVFPSVFSKIEEQSNDNGTFWLWTFTATDAEGAEVEVTATTSPRITPKTKAAKWLTALGAAVDVGEEIDFEAYYDTPVQLVIVINEAGYSRIESLVPFPASAPKGKGK